MILLDRAALVVIDPFVAALIRTLPSLLVGTVLTLYRKDFPPNASRLGVLAAVLNGLLGLGIGLPLFLTALSLAGGVLVTPLIYSSIFWAAVHSYWLLKEKFTRRLVEAIALFLFGLIILVYGKSGGEALGEDWLLAVPLALLAACLFGLCGALQKYGAREGLNSLQMLALSNWAGVSLLMLWLAVKGQYLALFSLTTLGRSGVFLLLLLSGCCKLVFDFCILTSRTDELTSVANANSISSLRIIFVTLLSPFILDEYVNSVMVAGCLIALAGIWLIHKQPVTRVHIPAEIDSGL